MAQYCKNGHKVDDQMYFCPQCGAEVTDKQFCKKCGHERVGDEQFCSNCGTPYKTEGLSVINNKVLGRSGAFFKKIPRSLIIGLLALFIVGGGLFYWFFIRTDYSFEGMAKTLAEKDLSYAGVFSDGLVMVGTEEGKIGYMDKDGNLVVPCKYDMEEDGHYSTCSEGLIKVVKDWKYGFIDKKGKEVISCKYDCAEDFSEGLAAVCQDEKWSLIDKKGNVVIDLSARSYDYIYGFEEGLAAVSKNGEWAFIDKMGKEVIPFRYALVESFTEGLAAVCRDERWGFIDKTGKEVIPCKYEWVNSFSEGLAVIGQDEKYGVIDKNGKEVIPCKYEHIGDFSEGLAEIYSDWKLGYIDKKGNIVIPCIYDAQEVDAIDCESYFSNGLALVSKDGQYGFINKKGEEVIPLGKYEYANRFSEGLAWVSKDGVGGFINTKGESTFDHLPESQMISLQEKQRKKEEEREEELRRWEEENNPKNVFYRLAQDGNLVWSFDYYEERLGQIWSCSNTFFFYPDSPTSGSLSYFESSWLFKRKFVKNGQWEWEQYPTNHILSFCVCVAYYTITEDNILKATLARSGFTQTRILKPDQSIVLKIIKEGEEIVLKEVDGLRDYKYKQHSKTHRDFTRAK